MLLLERWQAQAMADRQGLIARGAVEQLPTFASAQAQLDEALVSDPLARPRPELDDEQYELRKALGVA